MPEQRKLEERVTYELQKLYHLFGYARFKMSKFEAYDLYMQNKEFLVSDAVITFTDTDGTLLALKPDVTLSIVKNFRTDQTPVQKVCYTENVYRVAGAARQYREILQTGLECMGDVGLYELCEVLLLAARSLEAVSGRYILELSHMEIWTELFTELDLSDKQTAEVMALLAEKNEDGLLKILTPAQASKILPVLQISGPLPHALDQLSTLTRSAALQELKQISEFLATSGISPEKIHLDFSIVSNRNYYNGIVFRGYVEGIPTTVLAGGQYDKLMSKMGKDAKAVGFAIYLDQLELLDQREKRYDTDTVLLYTAQNVPVEIAQAMKELDKAQVLVLKEIPPRLRYRRLMTIKDGRLEEIENHG